MLLPRSKQDKLVRATDLDALSCRSSANNKGYFADPDSFIADLIRSYDKNLLHCEGYTQLSAGRTLRASFKDAKFPLINQGTYFRTAAIDRVVEEFIAGHEKCQIVSLGGGSDTRCFRVLQRHSNVNYMEIDFPESAKIKKIAISHNGSIQRILGCGLEPIVVGSKEQLASMHPDLHTPNYHLIGLDLRTLKGSANEKLAFLDVSVPTLVISECVLCYLTPDENQSVLLFWKQFLQKVAFLIYEPMSLGDAFGETMALNLLNRGIDLQTFTKYPDLASRRDFFSRLDLNVKLTDMALLGGYSSPAYSWIDNKERVRVSRLEMIDEVEEIRLLLQHYCLIYAEKGASLDTVLQLNWLM